MPTLADALRKQKSRSTRSRAQDARKTSKRVIQPTNKKGIESWIKNSGRRTDIRGLDTAGSGRASTIAKTTTARRRVATKRATPTPIRYRVSWLQSGKPKHDWSPTRATAQKWAANLREHKSVSNIQITPVYK